MGSLISKFFIACIINCWDSKTGFTKDGSADHLPAALRGTNLASSSNTSTAQTYYAHLKTNYARTQHKYEVNSELNMCVDSKSVNFSTIKHFCQVSIVIRKLIVDVFHRRVTKFVANLLRISTRKLEELGKKWLWIIVLLDEWHHWLKYMHLFLLHPVFNVHISLK